MTERKKRHRVAAEITLAHLTEFAQKLGYTMDEEEAIAFLNKEGRAYEMWKQMMEAGEQYIKDALHRQARLQLHSRHAVGQQRGIA